jgi:hypothetical protein
MFAEYAEQSSSVASFLEMFCEYDGALSTLWTPSGPIYEAYCNWCSYKVGEVVDKAYFGRQLKMFCGGFEPKRGKDKDRKSTTEYKSLVFDSKGCKAAIEALQLSMSHDVSSMSQVDLKEEEKEQCQKLSMSLVSQVNMWNEIKEKFGENSLRKEPQNSKGKESTKLTETPETPETSAPVELVESEPTRDMSGTLPETAPVMSKIDRPTPARKEDLEIARLRAGHAAHRLRHDKHTCSRCGKHDDIPFVMHDYNGYYCEPCRRDGAPSEPPKTDAQAHFGEVKA